ncbi:MAG: hypothetical protein Q4E70_00320 [Candidatus Saccharibacteria bacterium]|nr:hypothetical protein [Candidatus Saccharibacteria bacterium]
MDYSRFQKIYANLPEKLRNGIVVVIDDKPYTWNTVYIELVNNTELGRKMYEKLINMEII